MTATIRTFGITDLKTAPGHKTFPREPIKALGIIGDGEPRGFKLNGKTYAKPDKETRFYDELVMGPEEFINRVGIIFSSGNHKSGKIKGVSFKTNFGRTIQADTYPGYLDIAGPKQKYEIENIRLLEIGGGYYNNGLSRLTIKYIDFKNKLSTSNSEDSTEHGEVMAVTSVQSAFTTVTTYESVQANRLFAATRVKEAIFSASTTAEVSASNEGGVGVAKAKFEAALSRSIGIETTNSQEVHQQVEDIISRSKTVTKTIPEGYIGLEVVKVKVFQETDGFVWMYPVGEAQMLAVPVDAEIGGKIYDLTGALALVMPHLEPRLEKNKKSFAWIKKASNQDTKEKVTKQYIKQK